MGAVRDLRNLGPRMAERLAAVGITDADELAEVGTIDAFRRLKLRFPTATNRIAAYAIEGALLDLDWRGLPPTRKAEIDRELSE